MVESAEEWFHKGEEFYKLEKYEESLKCYEKALEINPKQVKAWEMKGWAYFYLGRYEDAIRCLEKEKEIDTQYKVENTLNSWGGVLLLFSEKLSEKIKYPTAIKFSDKALEINPNDVFAWYYKGLALHQLRKYESAINCFDKVIEIEPTDADAIKWKGMAWRYNPHSRSDPNVIK